MWFSLTINATISIPRQCLCQLAQVVLIATIIFLALIISRSGWYRTVLFNEKITRTLWIRVMTRGARSKDYGALGLVIFNFSRSAVIAWVSKAEEEEPISL